MEIPRGISWAALLWKEFFPYVCGKIPHAACVRNCIASCGQVSSVVTVYLKIEICNYCLSFFCLFVHSLPLVNMETQTALISIRNLFVSCHGKSVTSSCRFSCEPQTFFPAWLLHGCSPIDHKQHFWTKKRQMCSSCPFPEGQIAFYFYRGPWSWRRAQFSLSL